jgi:hypothetical protein
MKGSQAMRVVRVTASRVVPAPASIVYDLIADYHVGHPSILPPKYFEELVVKEGGRGAGTRIRFTMRSFGTRHTSHSTITEPEPGRVLVETDDNTGTTTRFIVEPIEGSQSRVTFETDYRTSGLRGWFESLLVPGYLRAVYAEELGLLSARAVEAARGRQ